MTKNRRLYPQEMAKIIQAQKGAGASTFPPKQDISVTIGIVSFNRWRLTKRCLDSVYADQEYPFQVLIIDSVSEPETITFLKEAEKIYPNLRVIYNSHDYGLSAARNQIVEESDSDAVFFLDNDIICQKGWLKESVKVATNNDAAFVASMRLEVDGTVWGLGTDLSRTEDDSVIEILRWFHGFPFEEIVRMMDGGECTGNFLSGGAGMIRTIDFRKLGGFDEAFFLGFGDLDFSLRLTEAGYEVWSAHLSRLTHDDQWRPQSETEEAYVHNRFNMDRLQKQAAYFRSRWGADPLPAKYVDSIEQRVKGKLNKQA